MATLIRDARHSLRMFRQDPSFAVAAVAALALGIGANTAIFSVVNTVLLKPPPFPDAERIVLFQTRSAQGGAGIGASPAKYMHWRAQSKAVQDGAAFATGVVNWTAGDVAEQLRSGRVSMDFFKLFGAPILVGRGFDAAEDAPNGPKAALIGEHLWERRFSRDPGVVGKAIDLGGEPHQIVGVVGASFDFRDYGPNPDVWTAMQFDPNTRDQGHYFNAGARLQPGVTLEQARAILEASTAQYIEKFPGSFQNGAKFTVQTMREALTANVRDSLRVLMGAVGLVLLIACANVANLLLARAVGRRREIAIRTAIGAGRWVIVRQLLTESVLLASAGGVVGCLLGYVGIRALLSVNTAGLPRIGENGALVGMDLRVVAFAALATLATTVLFGLIPAIQLSRADLASMLKESAGRGGSGFRHNKARAALVVVEVGIAVVLVVGAGLLIRTSLALARVNPGFDTTNVLTMRMSLAGQKYLRSAAVEQVVRDGVDRLRAIPGVEMASAACCIPLDGGYGLPFLVVGRPLDAGSRFHGGGGWIHVSPGYFELFKIPAVRGRTFTDRDGAGGPPVALVNQAMARQFWPKGDPLNDRILIGKGVMPHLESEQPRQIVGIVADVRDGGLNRDPQPVMYVPSGQVTDALNALNVKLTPMRWLLRTRVDPMALAGQAREQLRLATGLPVSDIRTMDQVVSISTSRQRFHMLLMVVFGVSALLLAAIGVYGLMAHSVERRSQEIGIRMALGADGGRVRRMVVFDGMRFALAGIAAGLAGAFGLAKQIESFLFGVQPRDPVVFAAIPALLAVTALVAVWLPAVRATRVDPVKSLRAD
jgi:predicted permease